jgi:hypothetical protein
MIDNRKGFRLFLASVFGLPIGAFAAYIAWLVVPEVLRVVVPAVVQTVASH